MSKNILMTATNDQDNESLDRSYEEVDSDLQIAAQDSDNDADEQSQGSEDDCEQERKKTFGQRLINNEGLINKRIAEIKANFYNRLQSQKLIKKQGRIPFTEHFTITNENEIHIPEGLSVHDDIKREITFYNLTRENVKKGMEILVQAKVPISRPDDFFAEMLKSDDHMAKVKSRLLKQQQKIQSFEEKKLRLENKKFHKAIKSYKQQEKHKEKREALESIQKFKRQIKNKGGDDEDKDFDTLFNNQKNKQGKHNKKRVMDVVKEKHQQMQKRKKQISKKGKGKRPGKVARGKQQQRRRK